MAKSMKRSTILHLYNHLYSPSKSRAILLERARGLLGPLFTKAKHFKRQINRRLLKNPSQWNAVQFYICTIISILCLFKYSIQIQSNSLITSHRSNKNTPSNWKLCFFESFKFLLLFVSFPSNLITFKNFQHCFESNNFMTPSQASSLSKRKSRVEVVICNNNRNISFSE